MELVTGCETENKYTISACDNVTTREMSHPFLYAKEKSDCMQRMCLSYLFNFIYWF